MTDTADDESGNDEDEEESRTNNDGGEREYSLGLIALNRNKNNGLYTQAPLSINMCKMFHAQMIFESRHQSPDRLVKMSVC